MKTICLFVLCVLLSTDAALAQNILPLSQEAAVRRLKAEGAEYSGGITSVDFMRCKDFTGEDLSGLTDLYPTLLHMNLAYSGVTNRGIRNVAGRFHGLRTLDLSFTRVTDEDFRALARLEDLQALNLIDTQVTGEGLLHLRNLTRLTDLHLGGTRLNRTGVKNLKMLAALRDLNLYDTDIQNDDIKELQPLTHLYHLELTETQVRGQRRVGRLGAFAPEDSVSGCRSHTR